MNNAAADDPYMQSLLTRRHQIEQTTNLYREMIDYYERQMEERNMDPRKRDYYERKMEETNNQWRIISREIQMYSKQFE